MYMHRVVNLGEVKDLLKSWDDVRQQILSGHLKAFALTLQDRSGKEAVYYGGVYKSDRAAGLKASMRQSWEMTQVADSSY
jgi:hypothetical protein